MTRAEQMALHAILVKHKTLAAADAAMAERFPKWTVAKRWGVWDAWKYLPSSLAGLSTGSRPPDAVIVDYEDGKEIAAELRKMV